MSEVNSFVHGARVNLAGLPPAAPSRSSDFPPPAEDFPRFAAHTPEEREPTRAETWKPDAQGNVPPCPYCGTKVVEVRPGREYECKAAGCPGWHWIGIKFT